MAKHPPPIAQLLQQQPGLSLTKIEAESAAHWAKPLSYTINKEGQVIALNLKGAGLTQLPITQDWPHLQRLDISRNAFAELVFDIDLPQLELLEASYNTVPLKKLVFKSAFAQLRYLYVYKSQLQGLPFEQGLPAALLADPDFNINLGNNNLQDDRLRAILELENVAERRSQFISYFEAFAKKSVTIKRAKLILLGNTEAGKTTLHDILTGKKKAQEGSTHGINQFSYPLGNIRVEGFDFGGQDYYHSTHLPFFSNNAIYLLVWGNRQADVFTQNEKGDNLFPLSYWLGSVRYFAGGSETSKSGEGLEQQPMNDEAAPEATIEPAQTNKNLALHLLQNLPLNNPAARLLNQHDLQMTYPFMGQHGQYCLKTDNEGKQAAIKDWVNQHIIDFAKPVEVPAIDETVDNLFQSHEQVLMSFGQLAKSPALNSLSPEAKTHLVKRLHYNLSCYYLSSADLKTEGYNPLNETERALLPKHIIIDLDVFTDWVYAILNHQLAKAGGYFTLAEAAAALKAHPKLAHQPEAQENLPFILAFMLHHKIIFRVQDENRYIAPNYLPPAPDTAAQLLLGTFEPALVQYRFSGFFHSNIITEILAHFFDNLLRSGADNAPQNWTYLLWKNKVLLYEKEGSTPANKKLLYIRFDFPDVAKKDAVAQPTISIQRFAKNHVSDGFLKLVMAFIEGQLKGYRPQKMVLAPGGDYIPYEDVIKENRMDGQNSHLVYHNDKIYRKGDFNMFLPDAEKSPMKRLFISYSKDDLPMVNQFLKHLAPLQRSGLIERWYCTELMAGSDWDAIIQAHFDVADIVCFMVSHNFLATNYIYEYELKKAFERKDGKDSKDDKPLRIVPIILEYCAWTGGQYDLSKYTALPYIAKPVADFKDQNMGWYVVVESLKYLIQNFHLDPTGEDAYVNYEYPEQSKQLKKIFERIVQGKVDNNA